MISLNARLAAPLLVAFAGTAFAAPDAPAQNDEVLDANTLGSPTRPAPPVQMPTPGPAGLAPGEAVVAADKVSRRKPAMPADMPAGLGFDAGGRDADNTERIVFRRAPVRIELPLNRERFVTFPAPVALHTPEGFDSLVKVQVIDRTAYVKAAGPFESIRVVAEDLTNGRQIPIDLVAARDATASARPVEIFMPSSPSANDVTSKASESPPEAPDSLDLVGLTRHAAQSLYAPRRLVPAHPGVRQVQVTPVAVQGLYRGWRVETTPIGAWRSGQLYVTAVRFTNQGTNPLDIDLQEMRGQWLAATAQHTRLLAAGSPWATTTVYLVCDRPFDACR